MLKTELDYITISIVGPCFTESGAECVNQAWRDVLGRWYRGCRQVVGVLADGPIYQCATSTNTEGYWTTLGDCLPDEENCLQGPAKRKRLDPPWILD